MIPRRRPYLYPGQLAEMARKRGQGGNDDDEVLARWTQAVAEYIGVPHAAPINSGRRGMELIFKHLGVKSRDEVIIPAYTLKALIPLIRDLGATPVPADIEHESLNISPESIAARITSQTKAILVLHAFGSPCRIEPILDLANPKGIPVIEDCAHSFGATVRGEQTGSFGHAGFFSFEINKTVNTLGGGMVVSRDADLIQQIKVDTSGDHFDQKPLLNKSRAIRMERLLFDTGLAFPLLYLLATPRYKKAMSRLYRKVQSSPPANVRYSSVQAVAGLKQLTSLQARLADRKQKAQLLRSLLKPEIIPQCIEAECEPNWSFFVVTLPRKAWKVRKQLLISGIDAAVEDEVMDDCAAALGYQDCPNVNRICSRTMMLPMYDGISERAIRKTASVLNKQVD